MKYKYARSDKSDEFLIVLPNLMLVSSEFDEENIDEANEETR